MSACKYVSLQVCQLASVSGCKYISLHICQIASILACKYISLYVCQLASRSSWLSVFNPSLTRYSCFFLKASRTAIIFITVDYMGKRMHYVGVFIELQSSTLV